MKAAKPSLFSQQGRLRVFALFVLATLFVLMASTVQGAPPQLATPNANMTWGYAEFADSPPYFRNMTDRSLHLDVNGNPRVAFGGKQLYYAWYDPDLLNWQLITIDPTIGVGEYAAMALDINDRPRISYFDTYKNALKFAYCNGDMNFCAAPGNWSIQTVDKPVEEAANNNESGNLPEAVDATPGVGMNSSIVVDKNNVVHISYYDSVNRILKYARWNGLEWTIEVVDRRYDAGVWSSIAVDDNAQPYISYMSEQYDDLKFAEIKSGSWVTHTIDENGNVGAFTSLALDSNGTPHISYRDRTNGNLKYAYRKPGGGWSKITVDNKGDVGGYTSIAVKSNDVPCISYYDYTNETLKYTCGDGWKVYTLSTIIEIPDDLKPEGLFTSIAFDQWDTTNIIYFSTEGYLKIARETPANVWSRTVINNYPNWYAGDVGLYTSLVLDNADVPHISYFSNYNDEWPSNLKYTNKSGGVWNNKTLSDPTYTEGSYTSIDLNSNGEPRIAYYGIGNTNQKMASLSGAAWAYHLVYDKEDENNGKYASLAVDSKNHIHISFYNATTEHLMYAYWDGNDWEVITLDDGLDNRRDVGKFTSIEVFESASGPVPAISYYDETEGNLRFAYKTPNLLAWEFEVLDTKGDVGQFSSLALVPDSSASIGYYPHIAYYDATNMNLKYGVKTPKGWVYTTVDDGEEVGMYASLDIDDWGRPHISYYDAINLDLMYATKDGVDWYTKAAYSLGDVGKHTSLALTSDNRPCISFYDNTNGALRYICSQSVFGAAYLPVMVKETP